MSYEYRDEERAAYPHALPDVEVFYVFPDEVNEDDEVGFFQEPGWYYWTRPVMLDSVPYGPFETEEKALEDARAE
jgi:hypothetical protein